MKQFSGVPQNVHINFPAGDVWRPPVSAPGVPGPRQTHECRVSSWGRPRWGQWEWGYILLLVSNYFLCLMLRWKLLELPSDVSLLTGDLPHLPDGHLGGGQSQEDHQENFSSTSQILSVEYIFGIHLFIQIFHSINITKVVLEQFGHHNVRILLCGGEVEASPQTSDNLILGET